MLSSTSSPLEQKVDAIFRLFDVHLRQIFGDSAWRGVGYNAVQSMRDLSAESNGERRLTREGATRLLTAVIRSFERMGGVFKGGNSGRRLPKAEIYSLAQRMMDTVAYGGYGADLRTDAPASSITQFELRVWAMRTVRSSPDLSRLFNVEWAFQTMSRLQRTQMARVHKFRVGLLTLEQLQRRVARLAVTHRVQLAPERKSAIHELALAMGADDPLKPDYSKYLPTKRRRLQSNVVPLEHVGYSNLVEYNRRLLYTMATRLQSSFRAMRGRGDADWEAKRQAFYDARETAMNEAEGKIMALFEQRETATGVKKMKWDAQVRVRQVKLRTKGKKLAREDVVKLIQAEEVAAAQADAREMFAKMEEERGFLNNNRRCVGDNAGEGSNSLNSARSGDLFVSGNAPPSPLVVTKPKPMGPKEKIRAEKKRKADIRKAAQEEHLKREMMIKAGIDPDNPNVSEDEESDEEKPAEGKFELVESELPSVVTPAPSLALETRQSLLVRGADLVKLYKVGMIDNERQLWWDMAMPTPSGEELNGRMRALAYSMSEKKVGEFLQELPSKRLLIRLVERFSDKPVEDLEVELHDHFGLMKRDVATVARCLRAIYEQDIESGKMTARLERLIKEQEACVKQISSTELAETMEEIERQEEAEKKRAKVSLLKKAQNELSSDAGGADAGAGLKDSSAEKSEDDEDEREPTAEEKAFAELQVRIEVVSSIRASVAKLLVQLERAEIEERFAARKHRGYRALEQKMQSNVSKAQEHDQIAKITNDDASSGDESEMKEGGAEAGAGESAEKSRDGGLEKKSSTITNTSENNPVEPGRMYTITPEKKKNNRGRKRSLPSQTLSGLSRMGEEFGFKTLGSGAVDSRTAGRWYTELSLSKLPHVLPSHRGDWAGRYREALGLAEENDQQIIYKYTEMKNLFHDFVSTATVYAKALIMEKHLPPERRSLSPLRSVDADVGRGDKREFWLLGNIYLKFATDERGICNGSDEYAAKYHGHTIRNSIAFFKCRLERVHQPMEVLIDFNGYRVHATSAVPIITPRFDAKGNYRKSKEELVYGSDDRGSTVTMDDKLLHIKLGQAGERLRLAHHGVKGERDLLPKFLNSACDLRGYRDHHGHFYLLNFRRLFPPEDPDEAEHLVKHPRGASIFWRQLRPEFVRTQKTPLSADALSMFTKGAADWNIRNMEVIKATRALLTDVIPAYADELSVRPIEKVIQMDGSGLPAKAFDIKAEMHRRGINMRHLGLLRSRFWFKVRGGVKVTFKKAEIQGIYDITLELSRGSQVRLRDQRYRISTDHALPHDSATKTVCLDTVPLYSANLEPMWCGEVHSERNSEAVRSALLAEILYRTLKNILRAYLRRASKLVSTPSEQSMLGVAIHIFNLVSGAEDGSEDFWGDEILGGVTVRFGSRAISEMEKPNLREISVNLLPYVITRVGLACGLHLSPACVESLHKNPRSFHFTPADVAFIVPRIKHNLSLFDFADGMLLAAEAHEQQCMTYSSVLLADNPVGYWPMSERLGGRILANKGTGGLSLSAKLSGSITLGHKGAVLNSWPDRAVAFSGEDSKADVKFSEKLVPQGRFNPFAVEAWVKCTAAVLGVQGVVLSCGRYSLMHTKQNRWAFMIFDVKFAVQIVISGPCYEKDRWTHLFGTFDGAVATFYVDGERVGHVDIDQEARLLKRDALKQLQDDELQRREDEKKERLQAKHVIKQQAKQYFATKAGQIELSAAVKGKISRSEARIKLNKEKAAALGWTKKTQVEARSEAVDDWVKEKLAEYHVKITDRHRKIIADAKEKEEREKLMAQDFASSPLRFGASGASKRAAGGKNVFNGLTQHIAVYDTYISRSRVSHRMVVAKTPQASQVERIYNLATQKFHKALEYSYDDPIVLQRFAETMCQRATMDPDRLDDMPAFEAKVRKTIDMFEKTDNPDGIAAMIAALPGEYYYGSLLVDCFDAVSRLQPDYFAMGGAQRAKRLHDLEELPEKFGLDGPGADSRKVACAGAIYRFVLANEPDFYGARDNAHGAVAWLSKLTTPSLVCYLINRIKMGDDIRHMELHECTDLLSVELPWVAENVRALDTIDLTGCSNVMSKDLVTMVQRCKFITEMKLKNIEDVDDSVLKALSAGCVRLRVLELDKCPKVTDVGVATLVKHCTGLRTVSLNYCEQVTDATLSAMAESLRMAEELRFTWCSPIHDPLVRIETLRRTTIPAIKMPQVAVLPLLKTPYQNERCLQLSDVGVYGFSQYASRRTLRTLDLSACRRVGDDGVLGIAQSLTNLTSLNLYYCNKVTDRGVTALTHNLWQLEYLNLSDLYLVTDRSFFFDQSGDGRAIADRHMLQKLKSLHLGDCNRITDHGVTEICRRSTALETLSLSGCSRITDAAVKALKVCPITGAPRGENIISLDLTFCIELSGDVITELASKCGQLQELKVSGCAQLTDDNIEEMVQSMAGLQTLTVAHCRLLTDRSIQAMASVKYLDAVVADRFGAIQTRIHNQIKHSGFRSRNRLTRSNGDFDSFRSFGAPLTIRAFRRLVEISTDSGVHDNALFLNICAGLGMIADQFSGMLNLNLAWCRKLTDRGLLMLAEGCHHLKTLNLTACDAFTEETVAKVVAGNVGVQIIR